MARFVLTVIVAVLVITQVDWTALLGWLLPQDLALPATGAGTAIAAVAAPGPGGVAAAPWWLAWVAGVLLLPLVAFPLLRAAVRRGSNLVTGYALLAPSVAELAVAPLLMPALVGQALPWLLLAALVGGYNLLSLNVALRFES